MATLVAEEIFAVFNRLRGSKTFYAAILAIAAAVHGYLDGKLTAHQALVTAFGALVALGLRDALAKGSTQPTSAPAIAPVSVDFKQLAQLAAHFDPPPVVAQALEHHGIPLDKFQAIFKTALDFADLAESSLPDSAPPSAPPPSPPTA
jgi:hypothetical protein